MVDKDVLLLVLGMYVNNEVTQEELSKWAYDMIIEADGKGDPLITEILFSLYSLHEAGLVFDRFGVLPEKLEYFINWLEDDENVDWPEYTTLINPNKLM